MRQSRWRKQVTLDGLAVTLAGATEPLGLGRIATDYTREMGGNPQASVIAGGFKTSMPNAAYANGTMAHALDYDNTWYPLNHPTSPTLPAILAIAENHRSSGRAVIESLVTAFEVQGRLRMAATGMDTGAGFHKPGMTGHGCRRRGSAAPRTGSRADVDGLRHRRLACRQHLQEHRQHDEIVAFRTRCSHGYRVRACSRARASPGRMTCSVRGIVRTFWRARRARAAGRRIRAPYRMLDPGVGFKKHPRNYFTHRPIDAALALRASTARSRSDRARRSRPFRISNTSIGRSPHGSRRQIQRAVHDCDRAARWRDHGGFVHQRTPLRRRTSLHCCRALRSRSIESIPNDFDRMHADRAHRIEGRPRTRKAGRQADRLVRRAAQTG